jgi:ATP-binding cassette, subfamily F, member 3
MSVLTASGLAMHFGAQDIFQNISVSVAHGDRVALVGANGTGKTTLVRILAGLETPSAGEVHTAKGLRIGYLPQQPEFTGEARLFEEMLKVFSGLAAQGEELRRLEVEMARPETREAALERYGELQHRFEAAGGYDYDDRIRRTLINLNFCEADFDTPLTLLSGGQRTRALLAKLLLTGPDLLLLDEPTNHLDVSAIEWLEESLTSWPGSLIVIAHDRRFLDHVATRVWEISFGGLEEYPGNYTKYTEVRAERHARRLIEYEEQLEQIAKTEEFIRRNMAGQRSKEAKGRLKRLNRLERLERPREEKTVHLQLKATDRAGLNVISTRNLVVGYEDTDCLGGRRLFSSPDLKLRRGERAALIGPNGSGKTTFLKTLLGQIPPLQGEALLGYNVKVGYFAQAQEGLQPECTVLDEILKCKNMPLVEARGFLGRYLFSGDDVFKPVKLLSGGERARVALAKLTLQGANLLLLDEPTNHLDIPSQEALQEVLEEFGGTILFVTHDRWLVDELATQVWVVDRDQLHVYPGGYQDYLQARERETLARKALAPKPAAAERTRANPEERATAREQKRLAQRVAELEEEIARLEVEQKALQERISAASLQGNLDHLRTLSVEYATVEERLGAALVEWTEAHERIAPEQP